MYSAFLRMFGWLYPASLGMGVGVALVLLLYRACEKRIGTEQWTWMFGAATYILWARVWRWGELASDMGLIPLGFAYAPEAELLAARGGVSPLDIIFWIYLAGMALFLLCRAVPYIRFRLRVRRESHPASERVERAFEKVLESVNADLTEDWRGSVRVMPSLPGPASVIYWPKVMLLDRETMVPASQTQAASSAPYSPAGERANACAWFPGACRKLRKVPSVTSGAFPGR